MLDAIKALIRCTAQNDAIPILTHVAILKGHMHAFNGRMYGRIKIKNNPFELNDICVRADMLQAALIALGDSKTKTEIDMERGTLKFNSKRYRANIPVLPVEQFYAQTIPELKNKKINKLDFNLPEVLATLRIIVGDNPMLPWSHGYLIEKEYIAVTNTSVMAKMSAISGIKPTIITAEFADELIAQGVKVINLLAIDGRVTAWLENGLVLSSVIIDGEWPKSFDAIIDPMSKGSKYVGVPETLAEALQSIVPFSDNNKATNVTFINDKIELVSSETASASITVDGLACAAPCSFNVTQLRSVLELATEWDLSKSPMVPFRDKARKIVGGFAGVKT